MSESPAGWNSFTLRDLGGLSGGKTPSKANAEFWSNRDVPWVSPKDMKRDLLEDAEDRISQVAVDEAGMVLYPAGSVLMVTRSSILQHTFPVALAATELTVNQDIKVLRPVDGITPKFAFYLLKGLGGKILSACAKDGTTVQSIDSEKLESFPLPIPSTAEQIRIAAKLDELLAQVDTLKARIDGVPALLKRFRQSVLAAAVSGRLTETWRELQTQKTSGAEISPAGWAETVFGDICREITVGYVGKMADQYQEEGVPFLRSQNVRPMRFSQENILYISEEFHSSILKSRLEPGDLAIVRSGAPGVTCVIPESLPVANCSDLVIARPSEKLNPWFGCIYMNSEVAQRNVAENQVGVAQQHFNVGSMKKMPINLPPLAEQIEIVHRVEQLFAFADQLEARVKAAQVRVDRLTQSILAKAFRGELVPQDPNDEPASLLLERIKAQRTAAPKAKRRSKALP
ncbi:restriction endonuclease subunit S [Pseudomonas sp. MN1F]|uniref:restriction endonuclease subunit S n=1 Tax=Pseudomonas sp. MN1F TaxID=1366632 RepID=UPI0021154650|nr:restriction endonuclease subunit S [Pseudomonas sp. MN1F]